MTPFIGKKGNQIAYIFSFLVLPRLTSSSIWDLFRSQLPFLTITDPKAVIDMIRSLIDTYRHLGWLPDCRMSLNKGYTQVSGPTRTTV